MKKPLISIVLAAAIISACSKDSDKSEKPPVQTDPIGQTQTDPTKTGTEGPGNSDEEEGGAVPAAGTDGNGVDPVLGFSIDNDLKSYEKVGSHYVQDPYPLRTAFTLPDVKANQVDLKKSYIVARNKQYGRWQLSILESFGKPVDVEDGVRLDLIHSWLKVGNHVLIIRAGQRLVGFDIERSPQPKSLWTGEEPSDCGADGASIDCNSDLKVRLERLLMASASGNSIGLSADSRYSGNMRINFSFTRMEKPTERYMYGSFTYSYVKDLKKVETTGFCSLRNGHLACKGENDINVRIMHFSGLGNAPRWRIADHMDRIHYLNAPAPE